MIAGATRASLLTRVARLEEQRSARQVSIGRVLLAARAQEPQPPTQTRAELERIVAEEDSWSALGRLAAAQLRVRLYISDEE